MVTQDTGQAPSTAPQVTSEQDEKNGSRSEGVLPCDQRITYKAGPHGLASLNLPSVYVDTMSRTASRNLSNPRQPIQTLASMLNTAVLCPVLYVQYHHQ